MGRSGARGRRGVLRVHALLRLEPVRHGARAGRRRRDDAEPAEPVHARAPAAALSRLRRADDSIRIRDGGAALDAAPTSAGSSRPVAGRSQRGRSSASASCSARTGHTSRSAGAATTRGTRRERGADAVARGDRVPPLGDDPGEARDAEGLEHGARLARVPPVDLRDVPHAVRRRELGSLVLAEPARRLVPRLHRRLHGLHGRADLPPAAAAPRAHEARVARLARGDVPLQQPAARRVLPDDPVGRDVSAAHAGGARRDALGVEAVLQLLPAQLRAAAPPADGDRPARRVAPRIAARARKDLPHPARGCARDGRRADRPRLRLVDPGPAGVHLLRVRRGLDRARVRPRHARDRLALPPDRQESPPLRRVHRARGGPAVRDRGRRLERVSDAA